MAKRRTKEQEERLARQFNASHPLGTQVRYWPGVRSPEYPPKGPKPTRSEAYLDNAGQAVVFLEGVSGCIALSHVEVVRGA